MQKSLNDMFLIEHLEFPIIQYTLGYPMSKALDNAHTPPSWGVLGAYSIFCGGGERGKVP